jgi:HEAT repeat protein
MAGREEVTEDLRRMARERVVSAKHFLAVVDRDYFDDVDLDLVTVAVTERDLLLPALRARLEEPGTAIRLNAAYGLAKFGDRAGADVLLDGLRSEDPTLRHGALDRLGCFGMRDQLRSHSSAVNADVLLSALELFLTDTNLWRRALPLIGDLRTPRAVDRIAALLTDARPDVRAEAACILGSGGHDCGSLAVIDELLQASPQPKRYHLIEALEGLCQSTDADVRARAGSVVIDFVRSNLADRGRPAYDAAFAVDDIWRCMDGIVAGCPPEQRETLYGALQQVLREVVASKIAGWIRGIALKQLAQLEGRAGIARLVNALSDPDLRKDALEGLASLAAGSGDSGLLEVLDNEIQRGGATHISTLVKAFVAAGGNARRLAQGTLDRLEPKMAMTVRWLLNDIGPREAAAKLQPAYGDCLTSEGLLQDLDAKWRMQPDATQVVWSLLEGWNRFGCVFYKTVQSPVDHDETIYEIAAIAGGGFAVDEVVQTTQSDGDFRISLVNQGTGYSFPVQNYGRWCNIKALLDGLNGILVGIDTAERFIELETGNGDFGILTFARMDEFMAAARELDIRLGPTHTS